MRNTIVVVLVLIVIGGFIWWSQSQTAEAPTVEETLEETTSVAEVETDTETAPAKEFTVTGKNFSFSPATLTVKKGDLVKITFENTQGFHNFVINEFNVVTSQKQSPNTQTVEFTVDKIGSFEYYCSVGEHRAMGMKGMLVVTE